MDHNIVEGRGEKVGINYYNEYTKKVTQYTFNQLYSMSGRLATSLQLNYGLHKGDMVIICSQNLIECSIMILALTRLGVVHFVVRDYFRSRNLAYNIIDLKPKVIVASATFITDGERQHCVSQLMRNALSLVGQEIAAEIKFIQVTPEGAPVENIEDWVNF